MVTAKKATIKKTATKKAAAPKKVVAKKVVAKKVTTKEEVVEEVVVAPVVRNLPASGGKAPTKKVAIAAEERYLYAVGRRKTAVAQVRLYPIKKGGEALLMANGGKTIFEYFGTVALTDNALAPLKTVGLEADWSVSILARGGGKHGQSDAVKLGVARALLKHDPLLRAVLKANGFLTRDARSVERKKPGLKKARKSPQWSKR